MNITLPPLQEGPLVQGLLDHLMGEENSDSDVLASAMFNSESIRLEGQIPMRQSWVSVFHLLQSGQRDIVHQCHEWSTPQVVAQGFNGLFDRWSFFFHDSLQTQVLHRFFPPEGCLETVSPL